MVLGKLPVPGRPTIWMIVGQGPIAFAVGAGGGCLDIFTLVYPFSPLSPFLWETARYRLKYCLKGPLNPKQPTRNSQIQKLLEKHHEITKRKEFLFCWLPSHVDITGNEAADRKAKESLKLNMSTCDAHLTILNLSSTHTSCLNDKSHGIRLLLTNFML